MANTLHTNVTQRSGLQYVFTDKHHGRGTQDDACWVISRDDEFFVFDLADGLEIIDERGRLYGALRDDDGSLQELGTKQEQIAVFTGPTNGPWHGYPVWFLNESGASNRASQKARPSNMVFDMMELKGVIATGQRKRLMKGAHV